MSLSLRCLADASYALSWAGMHGLRSGNQFELSEDPVRTTGYALLDAQLPGGGWPLGALIEILSPTQQAPEWQLIVPALAKQLAETSGSVLMVQPPYEPCGRLLQHQGVPARRLYQVLVGDVLQRLWVCEQALQCAEASVVMAWLPGAAYPALRRLHVAASKQKILFWAFRPKSDLSFASPAALRVLVAQKYTGALRQLELSIPKRRGPVLDRDVVLTADDARLAEVLGGRAITSRAVSVGPHAGPHEQEVGAGSVVRLPLQRFAA